MEAFTKWSWTRMGECLGLGKTDSFSRRILTLNFHPPSNPYKFVTISFSPNSLIHSDNLPPILSFHSFYGYPSKNQMDYYMDFFLPRNFSSHKFHSNSSFRRRPTLNNPIAPLIGNTRFSRPRNSPSPASIGQNVAESSNIFRLFSNALHSYAPIFTLPTVQGPPSRFSTICRRTPSLMSKEIRPMSQRIRREKGEDLQQNGKVEKEEIKGKEEVKMEEGHQIEQKINKKEELKEKMKEKGNENEFNKIKKQKKVEKLGMKIEEKKEEIKKKNGREEEKRKEIIKGKECGQKLKMAFGVAKREKSTKRRNKRLVDFCETISLFDFDEFIQPEPEFKGQLLNRRHFHEHFDTTAYLRDFYSRVEDPAMQLILFNLPNLVVRLGPIETMLDFGCGPTIHVAVSFREAVGQIYLADYLPQNREELRRWLTGMSSFDWSCVLRIIANREAIPISKIGQMEQQTKNKIHAILHCDCHCSPAVQIPEGLVPFGQFGAITSFLTIEYCCLSRVEYAQAIQRICAHLVPGGFLIMGGVLEETWCAFGGRKFACLYIDRTFMLNCLAAAGLHIWKDHLGTKLYYEIQGMYLLVGKKRGRGR